MSGTLNENWILTNDCRKGDYMGRIQVKNKTRKCLGLEWHGLFIQVKNTLFTRQRSLPYSQGFLWKETSKIEKQKKEYICFRIQVISGHPQVQKCQSCPKSKLNVMFHETSCEDGLENRANYRVVPLIYPLYYLYSIPKPNYILSHISSSMSRLQITAGFKTLKFSF